MTVNDNNAILQHRINVLTTRGEVMNHGIIAKTKRKIRKLMGE